MSSGAYYELYGKARGAMPQRPLDSHPEAIRASGMELKPDQADGDTDAN